MRKHIEKGIVQRAGILLALSIPSIIGAGIGAQVTHGADLQSQVVGPVLGSLVGALCLSVAGILSVPLNILVVFLLKGSEAAKKRTHELMLD